MEQQLRRSGYFLGLTADEYLALSILSAVGIGSVAAVCAAVLRAPGGLVVALAALGLVLPHVHTSELARARAKEITRGLPHAIEIAAMCMGAGLDFPGALRQLANPVRSVHREALPEEFAAILEELDLGHTRAEALTSFARRVPAESVRDFVNAVIQAERKGSPLARVLQVQGRMLNMRRSVLAEEAAARAGVLMIVPMVLLLACILLLLMGPFLVGGIGF
jgi:tight adherence protein C